MKQKPLKILVVEDDPHINEFFAMSLIGEGYDVQTTLSGQEAFVYLRDQPDFDFVLLDIMLQDISGIEVCRVIREELGLKELPICIITASMDYERALEAFKVGANGYLIKPCDLNELLNKVVELTQP